MTDVVVQQVTEPIAEHGEGPVWLPEAGVLAWVDLLAGDVLLGTRRWHVGNVAAALRPRAGGGVVLALDRGFALADEPGGPVRALPPVWTDVSVRMNDGGCDPDGRFYCGSMAYDERPGAGALYRLDPDGTVEQVVSGVTISNGFAFGPGGAHAYYIDTPTRRVAVFDYDSEHGLTGRRPFVDVAAPGVPDGLTVDADGYVWVALWGGGAVRRYSPAGVLDAVVTLPVSLVTSCAFGGPRLDRLYITTSRQHLEPGTQPEAGALFVADTGVRGLPPLPFTG